MVFVFFLLFRHYYVTPTSYLELINSFIQMLKQQRHVVSQAKWRYDVGLEKLADTASQVATMQKELEDLQPNLEKAAKETSEMMILVEKQQGEAAEKQKLVDAEAAAANEQARAAEEIAADCQKDLAAAMPALEAAVDALSKLSKGDITEVKAMKTPPGETHFGSTRVMSSLWRANSFSCENRNHGAHMVSFRRSCTGGSSPVLLLRS